jgi:hypothetical protein
MSTVTLCDQVACDPRRAAPNRPQIIQPLDVRMAMAVTPGGSSGITAVPAGRVVPQGTHVPATVWTSSSRQLPARRSPGRLRSTPSGTRGENAIVPTPAWPAPRRASLGWTASDREYQGVAAHPLVRRRPGFHLQAASLAAAEPGSGCFWRMFHGRDSPNSSLTRGKLWNADLFRTASWRCSSMCRNW